jgi:hypothetical protein
MTMVSGVIKAAVLCLLLAGCATNRTGTEGIRAFYCGTETAPGAYAPVRWSVNDTDDTIAQTKANNAVYKATC